ncbi:MAG: pentapeptide repeat-containing protein [Candidatus Thorarchaeota archaeon]
MIEYDSQSKKWILYTSDGSRVLGRHDTYEKALRQERAIQWSKRHRANPIPKSWVHIEARDISFPNENLDGEDLSFANLSGTDLSGSSFRGTDLSGACLYGCNLTGCDFTGAKLDRANLALAVVKDAVFSECSMEDTTLFDPEKLMSVADFQPISPRDVGAFVLEADLQGNSVTGDVGAKLRASKDSAILNQYLELIFALAGVDLLVDTEEIQVLRKTEVNEFEYGHNPIDNIIALGSGLNLSSCHFSGWSFEQLDLSRYWFEDAVLHHCEFVECELIGASFYAADLTHSVFRLTRMGDCNFTNADLTRVVFADPYQNYVGAKFAGARLAGTDFENCNLIGANFKDAKFVPGFPPLMGGARYDNAFLVNLSPTFPRELLDEMDYDDW